MAIIICRAVIIIHVQLCYKSLNFMNLFSNIQEKSVRLKNSVSTEKSLGRNLSKNEEQERSKNINTGRERDNYVKRWRLCRDKEKEGIIF